MLPYRTILQLPPQGDIIQLATQELQSWLRKKVDRARHRALANGDYFRSGTHDLGGGKRISVAQIEQSDGSRGFMLRLTEPTTAGTYEVSVTAIDNLDRGRRQDSLIIETVRVDDAHASSQVDPPRFVRDLLAREDVFDSKTHVTSAPRLVRADDLDEVFEAITDASRSVSVIVAASLGRELEEALRDRVADLTALTVGVTSVFIADDNLVRLLGERLPPSHVVEPGHVRTFLPGVDLGDPADGRRHRILGPETFARALRGPKVAPGLKAAFAEQTRSALVDRPYPNDVRKMSTALLAQLAQWERDAKIATRAKAALLAPAPVQSTSRDTAHDGVTSANYPDGIMATAANDSGTGARLRRLIARWLKKESPLSAETIDALDVFIANSEATALEFFEESEASEARAHELGATVDAIKTVCDDLELELAELQDEASKQRRRTEYLQARLIELGEHTTAYSEPTVDAVWAAPANVVELANILRADSAAPHLAFDRVEFTGDISVVEELQKRDSIGRYANAFWEYIRVLYDFVDARDKGYEGSVHMYLSDDRVPGTKVSPQRHAATESETVMHNVSWAAERRLVVPASVDQSGTVLMEAHFKPTHRDTIAPRMHYFDDTARTGKVYIGYIGRHLTNTRTKNA